MMNDRLEIRTLGGLTISRQGEPITNFDSRKVEALLVFLASTGRSHPRESLAEMFWEERTQAQAMANLRVALTSLRQTVEPFVDITRMTVGIKADSTVWLDTIAFEDCLSTGQIEEAMALYKGDFLQGFSVDSNTFENWTTRERERLRLRAQEALDVLITAHLKQGDYAAGIARANQLLAMDTLREKSHRQIMLLLAQSGERVAALEQYETCARLLQEEMGVEPAAETTELHKQIQAGKLQAAASSQEVVSTEALVNPYKGLRAFQEADAVDFFGRETLTQRLLDRLLAEDVPFARFLAVVGPSGCGKSSVVKAGLIPAIRQGALPGSADWPVVEIVPGSHPFEELEIALTRLAANPPTDLMTQLKRDKRGILRAARMVLPGDESQLLLIIDQFEEVFTLVPDPVTARFLLASLFAAVTSERTPLRVVITLRGDFYDRPLMYPDFSEMIRQRTEAVVPMTTDELEHAVTGPAGRVGISLETGLATTIVTEVSEQPGALPLLQYALTELFDRRDNSTLALATYQEIGGTLGALARRADAVYAGLNGHEQEAARQVFLRLVTLGEGTEDIRRRTLKSELISAGGKATQTVLDAFDKPRLLTFDQDFVTGEPSVELAHEAIIREWGRLRAWLDDSRHDLRLQRMLTRAAADWQQAGRDASYLLHGSRLTQFAEWSQTTRVALTADERTYLETSITEEHHRVARRRLIRRAAFAVTLIVSVVMAGLALVAVQREREAQREAAVRQSLALAANAEEALDDYNTDLAIALALEAYSIDDPPVEAERAIASAIYAPGTRRVLRGHEGPVMCVDISPDGRFAVSGGGRPYSHPGELERYTPDDIQDYTVRLWDMATGAEVLRMEGHSDAVNDVVFSPDGRTALSASSDKTLILWDVDPNSSAFGQPIHRYEDIHISEVLSVAFLPDGETAISGSVSTLPVLWNVRSGEIIRRMRVDRLTHAATDAWDIALTADGDFALTAGGQDDEGTMLWNLSSGEPAFQLDLAGSQDVILAVAISPDGRYALTGNIETGTSSYSDRDWSVVNLWDLETGEEINRFYHGWLNVTGLAFLPDGRTALSVAGDQFLVVWDLKTGEELYRLAGHTDWITDVAVTQDGTQALTSSEDGTLRLWDLRDGAEVYRLPHLSVPAVAFSADGETMATGSILNSLMIWDTETGQALHEIHGLHDAVWALTFTPDGETLIAGETNGSLSRWDVASGTLIDRLRSRDDMSFVRPIYDIAVTQGGRYLLSGGGSGDTLDSCCVFFDGALDNDLLNLWDLETGLVYQRLIGHLQNVITVAISPDGRYGLSGSKDSTLRLWDLATGEEIQQFTNHTGVVWNVAFSPDGHYALSGAEDRVLILWDLETGEEVRRFEGHSFEITGEAFTPDGRRALSASSDGLVVMWDVGTGEELRRFRHPWRVSHVEVSPDGRYALSGSEVWPTLWRISDITEEIIAWGYENRYVRELSCLERETYGVEPLCAPGEVLPTRTPYPTPIPSLVPSATPTINWTQVTATPTWTPFPSLTPTATPERPTPEPQGELTLGVMVRGNYLSNGRDQWTYSGTTQQTITIDFNGYGQKVTILSPEGTVLLESNEPRIGPVTLADTGTYAFIIESESSMPGSYMLTINQE